VRAFVTGGTGFIGTHLVNALLARHYHVKCLVRTPAKADVLAKRGVQPVRGDIHDQAALREGCAGADLVFHLAGQIAARNAAEFAAANRDGTRNLLEAATLDPPRRFVFVSSVAAAGPTVPGHPIDESRAPHPVTPYGRSKLEAEALFKTVSLQWTIVRPPLVYGEWDRATLGIFQLAARGFVPLLGDGSQELSAIHGEDLAAALVSVTTTDRTIGRVYFAAHPELFTTRQLAVAAGRAVGTTPRVIPIPSPVARGILWTVGSLARLVGQASVLSAERADELLAPAWTCRTDAIQRDAGWQAGIDLASGLKRTAAWYRREGWLS
jgi:nucleoside-diphosphate-sugar epimerase